MIELLAAPISVRGLFYSRLAGRLLVVVQIFLPFLAALLYVVHLGGEPASRTVLWSLPAIVSAAVSTTAFVALLAVSGERADRVLARVVLFVCFSWPLLVAIAAIHGLVLASLLPASFSDLTWMYVLRSCPAVLTAPFATLCVFAAGLLLTSATTLWTAILVGQQRHRAIVACLVVLAVFFAPTLVAIARDPGAVTLATAGAWLERVGFLTTFALACLLLDLAVLLLVVLQLAFDRLLGRI